LCTRGRFAVEREARRCWSGPTGIARAGAGCAAMARRAARVGVLLALAAPDAARADWETVPDPSVAVTGQRTRCWLTSVLRDHADGWPGSCVGLQQSATAVATADGCAAMCTDDVLCAVWQYTDAGHCWWGQGNCDAQGSGAHVVAGQRIQHGTVTVLSSLLDMQLMGLLHIGLFSSGEQQDHIRRCRGLCYSDTLCRYWQYGTDGCWVERRPNHVFTGQSTTDSDWARTMLAGEEVEHDCPERPAVGSPGPAPPSSSANTQLVHCQWAAWSGWGTCSASCGPGSQSRTRDIAQAPSDGGAPCSGQAQAHRDCIASPCTTSTLSTSRSPTTLPMAVSPSSAIASAVQSTTPSSALVSSSRNESSNTSSNASEHVWGDLSALGGDVSHWRDSFIIGLCVAGGLLALCCILIQRCRDPSSKRTRGKVRREREIVVEDAEEQARLLRSQVSPEVSIEPLPVVNTLLAPPVLLQAPLAPAPGVYVGPRTLPNAVPPAALSGASSFQARSPPPRPGAAHRSW